ncbi:unnamed protein product [Owenia fusiformis]|uniref:Uncharacterized protein n=1 Tax=Owenia fusiformis TaxID=6347 RepID=A0A8J1U0I6_OWEFU|nr:unnamed protein product [Owenia fusiformis]
MAQQGDDCYFFYYSSCSKGDMCPFRHCEAALGNETVCSLWQDGCCTRRVCKFRHMEIKKDRSLEQCYWETQPGGCTKPHCAFRHTKSDDILPASNHIVSVTNATTSASSLAESFDRLIAKPLEMKVKKRLSIEEEQIPSPIVQPVVINPLSDESDAESSSGHTPVKKKPPVRLKEVTVPSQPTFIQTRRSSDATDITDVNVEIKSLEQIRMEKLARAKAQLAEFGEFEDYLVEDEEDQRFIQDEVSTVSSRISHRLGPSTEFDSHDSPPARNVISQPIKASKSRVVHPKLAPPPIPQTRIKPPPGQSTKTKIGIKKSESRNPVNIGVRTLAEIKKSKIKQNDISDKLKNDDRIARRRIALAETGVSIREKRLLNKDDDKQIGNEDEDILQMGRSKRQKIDISKRLGINENSQEKVAAETVEVKVKSLDEIRREKALLSMQKKTEGSASSNGDNTDVDTTNKLESETIPKHESRSVPVEQIKIKTLAQIREEKKKSSEKPVEIKIKTLEEIRQEKALRLGNTSNGDQDTSPRSDVKKQKISVKKVLPRVRQLYQPPKSRDAESSSKSPPKKASQLDENPGNTSPVKSSKKINSIWSKKPDSSQTVEVDTPKPTEAKSTNEIKIKTFAEIMAEKKQRQKEMHNSSAVSEADPKPTMKRKFTPVVFDLDAKGSDSTIGHRSTSQQNSKITPSSKPVGAVARQTRKIKLNKNIAKVMPRTSAEANNQENNSNSLSSSMSSNKDVTTASTRTNLPQGIVTSSTDNDTQEKLVTSSKTSSVSVEPEISKINSQTPSGTVDSTPTPSTPSPSVQTPPRALSPRVSSSTFKRKISPSVSRQHSNNSDRMHSAEKKSRNPSSNADDDLDQLLNEIGDNEDPVPLEESKSADDLLLELEELLE